MFLKTIMMSLHTLTIARLLGFTTLNDFQTNVFQMNMLWFHACSAILSLRYASNMFSVELNICIFILVFYNFALRDYR